MRLAVISDIHGNGVGLEAVLDDLAEDQVDAFVCLGDVSEGGPQPVECTDRVRELGCPVVKGEVGFLICFACPSFVRRVTGEVHCAGGNGPPKEWLL